MGNVCVTNKETKNLKEMDIDKVMKNSQKQFNSEDNKEKISAKKFQKIQ